MLKEGNYGCAVNIKSNVDSPFEVIIKSVHDKSVATSENETDFTQGFELAVVLHSVTLSGIY